MQSSRWDEDVGEDGGIIWRWDDDGGMVLVLLLLSSRRAELIVCSLDVGVVGCSS